VVDASERLITLKFKCDVGKFITECDRLIQFNFYILHSLHVLKQFGTVANVVKHKLIRFIKLGLHKLHLRYVKGRNFGKGGVGNIWNVGVGHFTSDSATFAQNRWEPFLFCQRFFRATKLNLVAS